MSVKKVAPVIVLGLCMAGSASSGKPLKNLVYTPHAQADQFYVDLNGSRSEKGPGVAQQDSQAEVIVAMAVNSKRVVHILIDVTNLNGETVLFTPSTAFVTLPNGHSYAPYTQTDAIEALVRSESAGNPDSGYNPPSGTLKTNCTTNGTTTNCTSSVDSSPRNAYNAGYGIGEGISRLIAAHHLKQRVKELQEVYLTSREVGASQEFAGVVDCYVEDLLGGPFRLTLPVGLKTYVFTFGPSTTEQELPTSDKKK
jgi:hypothetical protein